MTGTAPALNSGKNGDQALIEPVSKKTNEEVIIFQWTYTEQGRIKFRSLGIL